MKFVVAAFLAVAALFSMVAAECPNACSAHGKCGAYDMCLCYRNWMSNDCSERICQFGLAHVDTPKGDLDASSGVLTGPGETVVPNDEVYPFGTTEQYPAMMDADGNVLTNSAHEYRECSNKGICDRTAGTCACFEGYDGSACQRASCPSNSEGVCSGHGTCESVKEIAARDYNNMYYLWDEDVTMGCVCDGGYTGADCSERTCKFGADPLYYDDSQNVRYSNWTYQFYAKDPSKTLTGNYSLVFYDAYGEDWQTAPLAWDASCETVTAALEELPNNVIPVNSVKCHKAATTTAGTTAGQAVLGVEPIYNAAMYLFSKYTLAFPSNMGKLQQLAINKYLDGSRPTLFTDEIASTLGWHIYPNGFIGEETDMVPDLCEDVTVTLVVGGPYHSLGGISVTEAKLLKKCLGDTNGDATDNVEVYDWDYGTKFNPHLIKLVDATQDSSIITIDNSGDANTDYALSKYPITQLCAQSDAGTKTAADGFPVDAEGFLICHNKNPPGFYAVLFFDGTVFRLYTRAAQDYGSTTEFYVYTTKGHLQMVNPEAAVFTTATTALWTDSVVIDKIYSNVLYSAPQSGGLPDFNGQVDCETAKAGVNGALDCLSKNDYVMVLSTASNVHNADDLAANPVYPNIYQVKKISREDKSNDVTPVDVDSEMIRNQIVLDYSMNANFVWDGGNAVTTDTAAVMYKFYPPAAAEAYTYAGECSMRGLCNADTGLCACFPGYSSDNCGKVNSLSN
mmetsp:Transcript_25885/g.57316  ORF Transcript_25885/g.57316 Transcript_25885/m.57316 type:complete len:736 (+) Transcript_25885:55-2262(+)